MTQTQAQIIELFQTLDAAEKRELVEQLYETAIAGSFYERMTPEQRAELDESISQADRGEGVEAGAFFDRMAKLHGFKRTA